MTRHKTLMQLARENVTHPIFEEVAAFENIDVATLMASVAEGSVVIPANIRRESPKRRYYGIGKGMLTKINANIGVSHDASCIQSEKEKAKLCEKFNVESIMDLSTGPRCSEFRQYLLQESSAIIGTVPVYELASRTQDFLNLKPQDFLDIVEEQAAEGVDFFTIHAGVTRASLEKLRSQKRLTYIVSRGGALMAEWMFHNERENPYYEHFDKLLEILKKYDVTLSLGDGLRPGSLHDATDSGQIAELLELGVLTRRAHEASVSVMIEGPGHIPLNEITTNVQLAKKLTHNAPLYVLGPLVTDIAAGYDHITAAIGGAVAAAAGADFLCYVTPAEHLRLPTFEDTYEGIIACKIAAHAADIAKYGKRAQECDNAMSRARGLLKWEEQYAHALDAEKARAFRESSLPQVDTGTCSMCGPLCSMRRSRVLT